MADLTARIKPKKSSTAGEVPQASDLEVAELAVNTADGKLFVKHTDNSIKEISGGGGGASALSDLTDVLDYAAATTPQWDTRNTNFINGASAYNQWFQQDDDQFQLSIQDNTAADLTSWFQTWQVGDEVAFYDGSDNLLATTTVAAVDTSRLANSSYYAMLFTVSPVVTFPLLASGALKVQNNTRPYVEAPPADGQVLTYVAANNQWEPVTPPDVQVIASLTDILSYTYGSATNSGEWQHWTNFGANDLYINPVDNRGVDATRLFQQISGKVTTIYHSGDNGATWTARKGTFAKGSGVDFYVFDSASGEPFFNGDQLFTFSDPRTPVSVGVHADVDVSTTPPTDGQVLTWDDANGVWEPATPATPVTSIDDLTDVDTSTTPPIDGQVLAWNSTNSEWEPASNADVSGASFIGKFADRDGAFNTTSVVVTFPSSARAGDLAIAMVGLRANGDPAPLKDVVTPSGWTLGLSADFSSSSSTTGSCSYFAFHKELSASDISTGSVTFTSDSPDAGDDWYYGLQVLRNAEIVDITNVDTTPSGSLASTGYDYTGSPVPSTGLCSFFAFNVYAFGTTSGIRLTPVTNNRLVMTDGLQYEVNVVRRSNQWVSLGEDDGFNIRCTNASNADSSLTDGFHIVRFRIVGKASSIDDLTDVDTSTAAPTDGQVLTWDNANSVWEPATPVASVDDLTDVDTSTAAPTDGQVLTWDNANSVWEPANPAVDSNTTQAGTGANAINNLVTISQVDYDALGTPDANTIYFIV